MWTSFSTDLNSGSPVKMAACFSNARAVAKQSANDMGWAALISAARRVNSSERETISMGRARRIATTSRPLSRPCSRMVL